MLDKENKFLYRLLKMIAFYSLPQNACLLNVRSFNTSKSLVAYTASYLGRFLYKNKLFIDIQENGTFNNAAYLRNEHFCDFLNNEIDSDATKNFFALQIKNWYKLSLSKLLPVEYRLDFDPFDKEMYAKLSRNSEDSKRAYLPIPLETLSMLVPLCINIIENYSKEILKIYNILLPVLAGKKVLKVEKQFEWTKAIDNLLKMDLTIWDLKKFRFMNYSEVKIGFNSQEQKVVNAIKNHSEWTRENPIYTESVWQLDRKSLLKVVSKLGIDFDQIDSLIMYDLHKIRCEAMSLVSELRNACVLILFLVTGMRLSEMYLLEAGAGWSKKGSEDDFRLKITVSKTSDSSSGDPVVLPIPEIAYKAYKCLESLTEKARIWGKSKRLMINTTTRFGEEISYGTIKTFIRFWCEDLGIEHINTHQFRKTIAMFAIYKNPDNIGVIRRLFSHKSLAMTLAYIVKMPGMSEEIKLAVIENNKQLLSEVLEAINNKCIGGKAGNRLKGLMDESKIFKANLYDEGWESIEQYIEILLQDGLSILHRTSFRAICTNTHSGLVHLGTESCNCNVVDCDWAVFTSESIEDLENDIKFHANLLEKKIHSEQQERYSRLYMKNCIERLCELKGRDSVSKQFPEFMSMGA